MAEEKINTIEYFKNALYEYTQKVFEKENKDSEQRQRNSNAWKRIDEELDKIQGPYRSEAFNTIKAFSLSYTPMGTSLYDKLISELTKKERKVLKY